MKKLVRLTENDLHRIVKESVNKALNKSNSVFYNDRPSKITKIDRSNSSNKHTMSPDEIEKIHNIVSEVSVAPNGYKHRFDPNKRDGDFPLEQPEWTKDPRWQGWNGEDPEWIMKQQEKYPYGGQSKQSVRLSEAELHQIVKESVNKLLKEVQLNELDPRTYASYAAKRQAQGQTNKAKDGEDAAIQAWNKQYGKKDTGTYDNVDDYGDRERIMRNNPYNNKGKYEVTTQYKDRGLGHLSTYRPTMDYNWDSDTEGYETQGKGYRPTQYLGIDDKGTRHYARREQSQQALQGYEVAKQMANNSGKYIKGKGWQ